MDHQHEYDVILIPAPEGGYVVSVPELPDIHTEGETREEALEMARDAIEGYLEAMRDRGWSPKPGEHRPADVEAPLDFLPALGETVDIRGCEYPVEVARKLRDPAPVRQPLAGAGGEAAGFGDVREALVDLGLFDEFVAGEDRKRRERVVTSGRGWAPLALALVAVAPLDLRDLRGGKPAGRLDALPCKRQAKVVWRNWLWSNDRY